MVNKRGSIQQVLLGGIDRGKDKEIDKLVEVAITITKEMFIALVGGNIRLKGRLQEGGRVRGKGKGKEVDKATTILLIADHMTTTFIIVTIKAIYEGHKETLIIHKINDQMNMA